MTVNKDFLIGVVGPCGSGKSTLANELDRLGYSTRHIAQEHSYVKDMWKRITDPDVLIFLQASFDVTQQRRSHMIYWRQADYEEQQRRLSHALAHADLVIETDNLDVLGVLGEALEFINNVHPDI